MVPRAGWSAADVRDALRRHRLQTRDLPAGARRLTRVALALLGVVGVVVVAAGAGTTLPGTVNAASGADVSLPVAALAIVALAVAAAAVAAAAVRWSLWPATLTLLAVATAGGAFSAQTVLATRDGGGFAAVGLLGGVPSIVSAAPGRIGLVCALVLVSFGHQWRERPLVVPLLAALPFLVVLVSLAFAPAEGPVAPVPEALRDHPAYGAELSRRGYLLARLVATATTLAFPVAVLLVWQVTEGVRAAHQASRNVAATPLPPIVLLVTLLGVKSVWVALGYLGAQPALLGGASPVWGASRADGVLSWAVAAALAAVAVRWWRRTPSLDSAAGTMTGPWVVIAALTGFAVIASGVWLARAVVAVWFAPEIIAALRQAAVWFAGHAAWPIVVVGCAAPVAAFALARKQRDAALRLFLAVFSVWALPRALYQLRDLVAPPVAPPEQYPGAVDLVTLDTVVTIALVLVVAAALWRRAPLRDPRGLVAVLLTSTIVAHAGTLVPARFDSGALFYAALLLPVAYALTFDAAALNEPGPGRPARVLTTVGITLGVLALLALQVAVGAFTPDTATDEVAARLYLVVPLAAVLLVARDRTTHAAPVPADAV